jgi:hypothetical protein
MKKIIFIVLIVHCTLIIDNCSAQWIEQYSGTTKTLWSFHFFNINKGIVIGENGTLITTSNGGQNWVTYPTGINDNLRNIYFINDNTGFVLGFYNLLRTTNGGNNWQVTNFPNVTSGLNSITFFNNNTGYLFSNSQNTFISSNSGINWSPATIIPNGYPSTYYCSAKINDTLIVIGGSVFLDHIGSASSFFYSTPARIYGGSPYSPGFMWSIILIGNSGIGYAEGGGLYWKTTNSGISWSNNVNNPHGQISFYNDTLCLNVHLAPSNYYHFDVSGNSGNSWVLEDSLLRYSALYFGKLLSDKIIMVVGDSGKILRNDNFITEIKYKSQNIPYNYLLSQNYPNPFNPSTNIRYEIPKNGFVKLVVFDILGREIQTLVNEKQNAGSYEVTFNARQPGLGSNLSSGIYFYKLQSGNYTETKRMLLIK